MLCTVLARDRTILLEDKYTLQGAKEYIERIGYKFSIRKTLNFYGLIYVEDRSFYSKYKREFHLKNKKDIMNITLRELMLYRNTLIGREVDNTGNVENGWE